MIVVMEVKSTHGVKKIGQPYWGGAGWGEEKDGSVGAFTDLVINSNTDVHLISLCMSTTYNDDAFQGKKSFHRTRKYCFTMTFGIRR